jgi:hypothetical protein
MTQDTTARETEAVVVGSHGDDLPGVDHAEVDPLSGDHDLAARVCAGHIQGRG